MKKTISVNIKGINFIIEEDAYEMLQDYMDRLERSLKNEEGSKEIIEDIELRIAELSSAKLNDSKTVIELEDIKNILSALGNPEDFVEDSEENNENNQDFKASDKHLYRDTDNALIAGVCAGIANYFKIDVLIVRAIFILIFLFAGFGIPIYIIMWIVVPKAKTTIDRLRMKGRPVTVENVREEVENAAEKMKMGSKKFANKIRKGNTYTSTLSRVARIISVLIGIKFILFGLMCLILFIIFGISSTQIVPVQGEYGFLSVADFGELVLSNASDYNLFWWGAFIATSSVVLFSLLLGSMLIFRLYNTWAKLSLLILFLIGLTGGIVCGVIGARTGRDFFSDAEIERELGTSDKQELVIIPQVTEKTSKEGFKVINDNDGFWGLSEKYITLDHVKFKYIRSTDSLFHITQNFKARGSSNQKALSKSENIRHNAVIKNDSLFVEGKYKFPKEDKLRGQEVEIIIEIPHNGVVRLNDHTIDMKVDDDDDDDDSYHIRKRGSLSGGGRYYHND